MRVALLTINAGRGGVVNVIWQLAKGLRQRGHTVMVACNSGSELPRLADWGVKHYPVPFHGTLSGLLRARSALSDALHDFQPDIVHSHSRLPSMLGASLGYWPDVSTLHSDRLTAHGSMLDCGPIRRLFSVWGRRVVTMDAKTKQLLLRQQGLPDQRVHIIPNGVDVSRFTVPTGREKDAARQSIGLSALDRVAVFAGSLMPLKGPDRCINALAAAHQKGIARAKLLMVGDGAEMGALQAMAGRLQVADHCTFAGWTDPTRFYHAADFLVLPSRMEGFGLVCVEAMLCGLPVLRTRCGGSDQQIIEGETGWSVATDDEPGFQDRFCQLMTEPEVLCQPGRNARRHALAHFSEERFLDATVALYDQMVSPRRSMFRRPGIRPMHLLRKAREFS